MARPYSQDFRDRVLLDVASRATCREAAARFGAGVAIAVRWSHRHRKTGDTSARPMDGSLRAVLAGERDWLLARIAEKPDLTFPKKPARRRAGPAGRGAETGTLAPSSV